MSIRNFWYKVSSSKLDILFYKKESSNFFKYFYGLDKLSSLVSFLSVFFGLIFFSSPCFHLWIDGRGARFKLLDSWNVKFHVGIKSFICLAQVATAEDLPVSFRVVI